MDRVVDAAVEKATPIFEKWRDAIAGRLEKAADLAAARDGIFEAYESLPTDDLVRLLADAMLAGDRLGWTSDTLFSDATPQAAWVKHVSPFDEAIDFFRARAFTIAGFTKAGLLSDMKGEIDRAMAEGATIEEFRRTAGEIFKRHGCDPVSRRRIDTIFRTNTQGAHMAARRRMLTSPAVMKTHPYWMYDAVDDPVTRPAHREMDGKIFPADHPIWDIWWPPNGFNCRCNVRPISAVRAEREGLTIERDDPTGTPYEPVDPVSGRTMPARLLMPDNGWSGRPGVLKRAVEAFDAMGARKPVVEKAGQLTIGRDAVKRMRAPGLVEAPADMGDASLHAFQSLYKRVMGISPNEDFAVYRAGDGLVQADVAGLAETDRAHWKYIRYFRKTLDRPSEVVLAEIEGGGVMMKHVGVFDDGVVIVGRVGPDGIVQWEATQGDPAGKMEGFRALGTS